MPETIPIADLLNRRSDLSTFLVHLTRDHDSKSAKENLIAILAGQSIEARSAMGWTGTGKERLPAEALDTMKVVCFSETPLEHVYSLFATIQGRSVHMSRYGLAFTKSMARARGVNPVWYVDMTMGRDWDIAHALDALREQANGSVDGFSAQPAAKILPFIEQMGGWRGSRKEFSWEREWRHLGDFTFGSEGPALVLCPEDDIPEFRALTQRPVIDPTWSLERTISSLAAAAFDQSVSLAYYAQLEAWRQSKVQEPGQ